MELEKLVRSNILGFKPYSSARDDYNGKSSVAALDANENPYGIYNRYPDPRQRKLKAKLAPIKGIKPEQIFLGNGSDEAIDILFRIFCEPNKDNVVAIDPTYGMYEVCADINAIEYRKAPLSSSYELDADALLSKIDNNTKLVFICSPNNPTGNCLNIGEIEKILKSFEGIVVIDEAYSDFNDKQPFRLRLDEFSNLVVLNTFSKAWGSAAIRLGMAFASKPIIDLFNKVKYPYNVNNLTQEKALSILNDPLKIHQQIVLIKAERSSLIAAFASLPIIKQIYPTDANFFLCKTIDANKIYAYLVDEGIVVRNRNNVALCKDCLRITIGSKDENTKLLAALRRYKA